MDPWLRLQAAAPSLWLCSTGTSVYVYMAVAVATTASRPADFHPWRADRRADERGRDTEGERERTKEGGEGNLRQGRVPFRILRFLTNKLTNH